MIVDAPAETWIGNIWSHGGDAAAAMGMRSVTLVNYNLTLSGPPWFSLQPRPQNESFPNCGMCGTFTPATDVRISVRCPETNCRWSELLKGTHKFIDSATPTFCMQTEESACRSTQSVRSRTAARRHCEQRHVLFYQLTSVQPPRLTPNGRSHTHPCWPCPRSC